MGLKITNMTEVMTMFRLADMEVTKEARDVVKQYAEIIRETTRAFAPVDEHRLEKAIKVLPSKGNRHYLQVTIGVGGVVNGRDVSEYAAIVHEYPWEKRGPLTRMKGPRAGPRYLRRAVEHHRKDLQRDLKIAVAAGMTKAVGRSGVNKKKVTKKSTRRRR